MTNGAHSSKTMRQGGDRATAQWGRKSSCSIYFRRQSKMVWQYSQLKGSAGKRGARGQVKHVKRFHLLTCIELVPHIIFEYHPTRSLLHNSSLSSPHPLANPVLLPTQPLGNRTNIRIRDATFTPPSRARGAISATGVEIVIYSHLFTLSRGFSPSDIRVLHRHP
jgi:hypothetical protein